MSIQKLPLPYDLETKQVLKKVNTANKALAELKGVVSSIPNAAILINALVLQEAKDSSAIENIITTHDDLYKAELSLEGIKSLEAKEVQNYIAALKHGFDLISEHKVLTVNQIQKIQATLEKNNAGLRRSPGTTLTNAATGKVVYTPPQNPQEIQELMSNLEMFINNDGLSDLDPLIKMAIIHHQFESIHPFYDGNGRTGRIINVLYLVIKDLLELPILYLSRYIIANKAEYYRLLQDVRETNNWEPWLLYIIAGVEKIANETIQVVKNIQKLMSEYKHSIRAQYKKFYSQDLLNNLFKHPYTKIEFMENDLGVSRKTAANYLNTLVDGGFLKKAKLGQANYYINERLYNILLL